MATPPAFSVFGMSAGMALLVIALLVLYVWFCVYWWRGGRPMGGHDRSASDERGEPPRRRAA
jgi:hypothetical protein